MATVILREVRSSRQVSGDAGSLIGVDGTEETAVNVDQQREKSNFKQKNGSL